VDAETGVILRLTRFKGGRPAVRQELRDVAEQEADTSFGFTPPAGLRVDPMGQPPDGTVWSWGARG
jgi:hypothetical protein